MNKLIIIGNGFDLAHGLKTSYCDFLLWYLNKSFYALEGTYKYEDDLMTLDWGTRKLPSREITSINQILNVNNYFKISFKNTFFQQIIENGSNYGWVDIETFYYSKLVLLFKRFEHSHFQNVGIIKEVEYLNSCFNSIKRELIEYLSTINVPHSKNLEINAHIIDGIDLASVNKVNTTGKKVAKSTPNNKVYILNFNYTSTIDLYLRDLDSSHFDMNFIHGKLGDRTNPIIFGYGDEMHNYYEKIEQADVDEFLMNIKSFGYLRTNNYQKLSSFLNSHQFEAHIMGHSCGLSDRILLSSIFEHDNCKKVKIFYYDKGNEQNDHFEKTQKISRHFRPNTKHEMRLKIASFPDSKPLLRYKR